MPGKEEGTGLDGTARLKEPLTCTEKERDTFAHLVREGFRGSDKELPDRILQARCLAFSFVGGELPVGIAGLKAPGQEYREDVFEEAGAPESSEGYGLELGWVYVLPRHRGKGIASGLCRLLLSEIPSSAVFATTRPDNDPMTRILLELGFERVGRPFQRRDEELVLFLRTPQAVERGEAGKPDTPPRVRI